MVTTSTTIDVADELKAIAAEVPLAGRLGELAAALRDLSAPTPQLDSARHWATVDLFETFLGEGSDELGTPPSHEWLWRAIDTAVQVLVFVPIAVTWLGLALAAGAFRAATAAGDLHGQSFLQGWQEGFGGRVPGWLTFNYLASYTSALVFLLIAATATHVTHARRRAERQAAARQRVAAALSRANLELAPLRLGTPDRLVQELGSTLDKLREAASAIEDAGKAAVGSQQKAADAISAVAPALDSAEKAARAAATAADVLERAPDKLGNHLGQLATASGDIAATQRSALSSFGDASTRIASALEDGADRVRKSLAEVGSTAAIYAHRTEQAADILGQAQQTVDELPSAVTGLQRQIENMGKQAADLASALAAAKSTVPEPDVRTAPIEAAATELHNSATALRTAAVALQHAQSGGGRGHRIFPWGRRRKP